MSKRKAPERAAAAAGAAPPPRLGDHASYMPEPLVGLADVHIKVKGGAVLPAHAMALLQHCGALARSAELFADATSKAPVALSSPFDEYAEADVARFLRCIYTAAAVPAAEDITRPAVVRLAHALDAAAILAAARRHLVGQVRLDAPVKQLARAAELAVLCGWDDVRAAVNATLLAGLQAPLGAAATPAQLALSDVDAFDWACGLVDHCPPELVKRSVGALAANFRRLCVKAPAAARAAALSPAQAAAAGLAVADGSALEIDGRFMGLLSAPAFTETYHGGTAAFKSHGLEWELLLEPNGAEGKFDGRPVVGVALTRGCPKTVRCRVGFVNLLGGPPREWGDFAGVLYENDRFMICDPDMEPARFRDPGGGWVVRGLAAPLVCILEVRDPTPEELAEAAEQGAAAGAAAAAAVAAQA